MALDDDAFKSGRPIHGEPGALDCEAPANDQIERKILDYAQKYRGRGLGTAFIRRGVLADIHADIRRGVLADHHYEVSEANVNYVLKKFSSEFS